MLMPDKSDPGRREGVAVLDPLAAGPGSVVGAPLSIYRNRIKHHDPIIMEKPETVKDACCRPDSAYRMPPPRHDPIAGRLS